MRPKAAVRSADRSLGCEVVETDARQPLHRGDPFQKPGEGTQAFLVAVAVDVLAQQGHFAHPVGHQGTDLVHDALRPPAGLSAPHIGHHAVGTVVVAALHDGDKTRHRILHHRSTGPVDLDKAVGHDHVHQRPFAGLDPSHQAWQPAHGLGAENQIHVRGPLKDAPGGLLGHASAHRDAHPGTPPLNSGQPSEQAENLLFGLGADGAGVDDHKIGRLGRGHRPIPQRPDAVGHQVGVVDVHLAADGLDVEALSGHGTFGRRSLRPSAAR